MVPDDIRHPRCFLLRPPFRFQPDTAMSHIISHTTKHRRERVAEFYEDHEMDRHVAFKPVVRAMSQLLGHG